MSEKKVKNTLRIAKRSDGQIFTLTPELEKMPNMHAGTMTIYTDGSKKLDLDKFDPQIIDSSTTSERERRLMLENAELKQRVAELETQAQSNTINLGPEESVISEIDSEIETIDTIETEDAIPFQEEAPIHTKRHLEGMKKEDLITHAHELDRSVNLPDSATKKELVEICLELQEKLQSKLDSLEA